MLISSHSKKLSIETNKRRGTTNTPTLSSAPQRRLSGGAFKQPYSADSRSPGGYLTPVTPLDRGVQSAGPGYHPNRGTEMLGSPLPTSSRSAYSPDSTSTPVPASRNAVIPILRLIVLAMNSQTRYPPQDIRPYGQVTSAYLPPDTRTMTMSKVSSGPGREEAYVAVPLMTDSGSPLGDLGKLIIQPPLENRAKHRPWLKLPHPHHIRSHMVCIIQSKSNELLLPQIKVKWEVIKHIIPATRLIMVGVMLKSLNMILARQHSRHNRCDLIFK